jgi:ATP-dependent helicase/nuclease subunit B
VLKKAPKNLMLQIFVSHSGSDRLSAASRFLSKFTASAEIIVVGSTRAAVDDLIRQYSARRNSTFGLHRFSLSQLAGRISALQLAAVGHAPCSRLGAEAVASRAIHALRENEDLHYFSPVAGCPGFARAVHKTVTEIREAGIKTEALKELPTPAPEIARLSTVFDEQLTHVRLVDRAAILHTAASTIRNSDPPFTGLPVLLLDVPIHSEAERDFVGALVAKAPKTLITVPAGDDSTQKAIRILSTHKKLIEAPTTDKSPLSRLAQYLFSEKRPPSGDSCGQVQFFSAPGEARECIEIARRILEEAKLGIHFDQMAIFVRSPRTYAPLLESAMRRSHIPVFFSSGTSRPDRAGRAFLAILACADENLSAKRFAEYLSLGQVPELDDLGAPPKGRAIWVAPTDELLQLNAERSTFNLDESQHGEIEHIVDSDESPQIGGTLRAPWNWEKLLVEASVIGGKERWERRLNGLDAEFCLRLEALAGDEADSPKALAIRRELQNLLHLKRFALPLMDHLSRLPKRARWGEWLSALQALAATTIQEPERILSTLAEMSPLDVVGPISLFEVRNVLSERISTIEMPPPSYRYGRVFVATPEQARGWSFETVFVPGLAERIFPQRPREDPLLLDDLRKKLGSDLRKQADRISEERLFLRLCVGSARQHLYLSYPRLDVGQARPRVPSFYALDVERALTGEVPRIEPWEYRAGELGGARLAWPAPSEPSRSIDAVEHDLSVLGRLLRSPSAQNRGAARYLLQMNKNLARSLRTRFARWNQRRWSGFDGLFASEETTVQELSRYRLRQRPYSVSALQKYATCPYHFFLAAIHGLEPRRESTAIERLDPLTRGQILHRIQADFLSRLREDNALPVSGTNVSSALRVLEDVFGRVEAEYRERTCPAILRVWADEIEVLRTDLRLWVSRMDESTSEWVPSNFELSFGLSRMDNRDPASVINPVAITDGFLLRGIVDLVESRASKGDLRVTDHKSGENRTDRNLVVGAGEVLQPAFYSLAVESIMERPVGEGRLYFCTIAGGFSERSVPMNSQTRETAGQILRIIDGAVERGFFPPAPRDKACEWCDFLPVCGPYEEIRAAAKDQQPLSELNRLRTFP